MAATLYEFQPDRHPESLEVVTPHWAVMCFLRSLLRQVVEDEELQMTQEMRDKLEYDLEALYQVEVELNARWHPELDQNKRDQEIDSYLEKRAIGLIQRQYPSELIARAHSETLRLTEHALRYILWAESPWILLE